MTTQIIYEITESFFAALKSNDVDMVTKRLQEGMMRTITGGIGETPF